MKLFVFYHDDGCEFAGITKIIQAESEHWARLSVENQNFEAYKVWVAESPPFIPGQLNPYYIPPLTRKQWDKRHGGASDKETLGELIHVFDVLPNNNPDILP